MSDKVPAFELFEVDKNTGEILIAFKSDFAVFVGRRLQTVNFDANPAIFALFQHILAAEAVINGHATKDEYHFFRDLEITEVE